MDELRDLNEQLGFPSAAKLLAAAKRKGIDVKAADVKKLAKNDPARQVFGKPFAQKGHQVASAQNDRWQADLIDLKQYSAKNNEGKKAALLVTDVFTRQTKTAPVASKKPAEIWEAFQKVKGELGGKPSRLDTDAGAEFLGEFEEKAKADGIAVQSKNPEDVNGLAINDRSMQSIKNTTFRLMAKEGSTKWVDKLGKATSGYNATPHSSLLGEAPEDVPDQKVVQFRLQQEMAEKQRGNVAQLKARQNRLEEEGGFRVKLPRQHWTRGFKPKWSNRVRAVTSITGGQVRSGTESFDVSQVLPVPRDSAEARVPAALAAGSEARKATQQASLRFVEAPLRGYLKDGPKTLAETSTFLRGIPGFELALTRLRLNRKGGLKQGISQLDGFLVIGGAGQNTVQLRPTRRLTRK